MVAGKEVTVELYIKYDYGLMVRFCCASYGLMVRFSASIGRVFDPMGLESNASMAAALRAGWHSHYSAHDCYSRRSPAWAVRFHSRG
jgi:hypothetical protein